MGSVDRRGRVGWPKHAATLLVGVVIILTMPRAAPAWDAILTCRMDEETGFTIEKGRVTHKRSAYGPNEIVFAGLDSSRPTMKGNAGESQLAVIRREADTVWLIEQPPIGGINVYTLFRDAKRVIGSKQYRADMLGVVFALMSIGQSR